MRHQIETTETTAQSRRPADDELGFGQYFTDHMFMMDYEVNKGWHRPRIVPFQPLTLHPAAKVLHYGQAVFEGLKAYRSPQGRIYLFRPHKNFERLNLSNARLSIPAMDEEVFLDAVKQLVTLDRAWVPSSPGTALYIRPFIISTEPTLSVHPSETYQFIIILSPVGAYNPEGINPTKIYVEDEHVRAIRGGMGTAKTAGNYAAGLNAQERSAKRGFSQVLWLDGVERKYIEEVGSMNVFFKTDTEVITPALNGSVLSGITRDSVIQLLKHMGIPVVERKIAIDELFQMYTQEKLTEAFGTGTAVSISPIGEMQWKENHMVINGSQTGPLTKQLYETLTAIQYGIGADPFGWRLEICQD